MQGPDTVITTPEKAKLFELPYKHVGLTVQGVNAVRLTPYPNPNISVPNEVGRAIQLRNLARLLTESGTAIARVGLGLRPAGRTVSAHVQAAIFFAGLARKVAYSSAPESLTPTAAPPSNDGVDSAGYDASVPAALDVELPQPLDFAQKFGSGPEALQQYTSTTPEHAARVLADMNRGLAAMGIVPRDAADTEVEL